MAYFDAKHENGTSWKLAVPSTNRDASVVTKRAALFVRNYCLKNSLTGEVNITPEDGGPSFRMSDYVAAI